MVKDLDFAGSFTKLLTPARCEQLDREGYLVLDENPLPDHVGQQFLAEIKRCFHELGGGTPNQVEFLTRDGPVKLTKPHIYECDLHQRALRAELPLFRSLFDSQIGAVADALRERVMCCADLEDCAGAAAAECATTLKLQMNEGGAFPWHYDNPGRPNKRRLTLAVYLTEGWEEGHGGELQLMPFLRPVVTVPPRYCTVALFRSDLVLHRVRPQVGGARRTRYCFTVWFDGATTNTDADLYLKAAHLQEAAIPFLMQSPVQRTLSRAVYDEAYRQALADCFGAESVACRISFLQHQSHIQQLLANPKVVAFLDVLRTRIEENTADENRTTNSPLK